MDRQIERLRIEEDNYYVQDVRRFEAYKDMIQEEVQEDKRECFEFAYNMSYAKIGAHRDSRSGGTIHRTLGQIFINTFQGKMAEFALYRYLKNHQIDVKKPDVTEYGLGKWDSFDLECQGKYFAVKSTKFYGNLLLLETKDWSDNGEYVPNSSSGTVKYDYIVLVRLKPDGEELMRQNRLLYQREDEVPDDIKELLMEKICGEEWSYDFPGFIYHSELVKAIEERCVIPQNAMLNGKTKMDADNYYFH